MSKRFLSDGGRFFRRGSRLVGQGQPIPVPIGDTLAPVDYEGAVAYGNDGKLYYSDGVAWVIPTDDAEVSRPFGQIPTTPEQQTQLRLSLFRSPTGLEQVGIFFEISTNGVDFTEPMTRTVMDPAANLYQIVFPDDGFVSGDEILWRAAYLGSGGGQSEFSVPLRQRFPDLIQTPTPITTVEQIVGEVEVTPYTSPPAFGLPYFQTETEFYTVDGETLIETVTHGLGGVTRVPEIPSLPEQTLFAFRSRYAGRVGPAGTLFYSEWSVLRVFFNGVGAMLLEYNLDEALSRTVNLPIGVYDATDLNVTVDWGDGNTDTYTTGGVKSHVYAAGAGPTVTVSIRGNMRQFGGNTNQQGLKRVITWGLKLGLTSLREALRNTRAILESVPNELPRNVTSIRGLFQGAILTNAGLSIANMDTSNITNMASVFEAATSNKPLTNWVTSNVTTMESFCYGNLIFNQPVAHFDMSSVTTTERMFGTPSGTGTMAFNQPIGNWVMSSVLNTAAMFGVPSGFGPGGSVFNQPIGGWDMSNVINAAAMFRGTQPGGSTNAFNQDVSAWDMSSLQNGMSMFERSAFNNGGSPGINNWVTTSLTNTLLMFGNSQFNQPIGNWDMSKVTTSVTMLINTPFNHPVGNWDMSSNENMGGLFSGNTAFNQDVSAWPLRAAGLSIGGNVFASALDVNNTSKLLTGWANTVNEQNGPRNVTFSFTRNYDNRSFAADFPGKRFADAVTARAFLVAARSVIVSGAGDATANGTYLWNSVSNTYTNTSTDWFFVKLGTRWELRDDDNVVQATSASDDRSEPFLTTWDTILAAATLLLGGAGWTITGGSNVS
jgi:hypothetical protein